ncbi:MAG: Trk system potassium transporter TrkA [Thermoplasmata archaeon]
MKVVITGAGEVGYELAESIRRKGHDVIIIDKNDKACKRARALDVKVVKGNGARPELLNSLDIEEGNYFFAVTDDNEANLVSCAIAKAAGCKTIARINGLEYVSKPISTRFSKIGVDYVVSPELIIARKISDIIIMPSAIDTNLSMSGKIDVLEFKVLHKSRVEGRKLKKIKLPKKVNLGAIIRGNDVLVPHGNTVFREDDTLIVMSQGKKAKEQMLKLMGTRKDQIHQVMIIGATDIGINVAKTLEKRGIQIKLIENSSSKARRAAELLKKVEVIQGDAREKQILIEEGILRMDAFAATTSSEEFNVLVSLLAKIYGVEKTIAVVRELSLKSLIETVGIDMAASPQLVTSRAMLRIARELNPLKAISFHGGDLYILETVVSGDSPVEGKKLEDLSISDRCIIGAIIRDDRTIIPRGTTKLREGDQAMVFVMKKEINNIEEFF